MDEPLITRTFNTPRKLIFNAWVDAGKVSRWLAPPGFTIPQNTIAITPRAGGRYDYCMVETSSGNTFWLRNKIIELVEPELLVLESEPMPEQGFAEPIITRIELEDVHNRTILRLRRVYPVERRKKAAATWNSSLDQLERLLLV